MTIIDEALLDKFRWAQRCDWCKGLPGGLCDPHHIFSRGTGRLDIRENLVSLCRRCHGEVHMGQIMRDDLLAIVAKREGTTQDAIRQKVYTLRRTPRAL